MAWPIGAKATESQNLIALSHSTIALASHHTTDAHTAPLSVASRDVASHMRVYCMHRRIANKNPKSEIILSYPNKYTASFTQVLAMLPQANSLGQDSCVRDA